MTYIISYSDGESISVEKKDIPNILDINNIFIYNGLIWENEHTSINDDGAKAFAQITDSFGNRTNEFDSL
jgi:hypothetical protein